MNKFAQFGKATLIGGLLVLFPVFGCVYLIVRIAAALTGFIKPVLSFLPQNRFMGVAAADVASIVVLILVCFLTGLAIKTSLGNVMEVRVSRVLNRVPGYRIFRHIARILFDKEDARGSPVVVQRGQAKQIGFMIEENAAGETTVFFPNAPTVFSGNIVIVKASAVEKLDVPAAEVARMIATFGTGTNVLLANRQAKNGRE